MKEPNRLPNYLIILLIVIMSCQADKKETSELVAFCDVNQTRMDYGNKVISEKYGYKKLHTYKAHEFDKMIEETKTDVVIVTSVDRTHHRYIIRAMELGCDVISEKPMTVDADKAQQIIDTTKKLCKIN